MRKKYLSLILFCITCSLLTGCTDVIELTDTETRLIAEYAGELLLKYDVNYDDRLDEGDKIEQELEEEAEEAAENGILPVTTEEITTEAVTESEQGHNLNSQIDDVDDQASTEAVTTEPVHVESDIAKILGFEGISITCKDYLITDQYPTDSDEDHFIDLQATEGYKLLVVRFNVTNTSSDVMNLTMLDEAVDYRIVCNGNRAANPMLTILMNDLATMETVLSPSETQEGVLVFQVSDDMSGRLESMELKVEYNGQENVIQIL